MNNPIDDMFNKGLASSGKNPLDNKKTYWKGKAAAVFNFIRILATTEIYRLPENVRMNKN